MQNGPGTPARLSRFPGEGCDANNIPKIRLAAPALAGALRAALAGEAGALPARVKNVNTTDIRAAVELGCRTMSSVFNADDHNIPFFGSSVWPEASLSFYNNHTESHVPGRHLNALLNAEDALRVHVDEGVIDKHTRAALFSYSGAVPLPLNREHIGGKPVRFLPHNIREGMHALYALVKYRNSGQARELAERSIAATFQYWKPDRGWDRPALEKLGLTVIEWGSPFMTGVARAIGPLVKYYRATGYGPALELALVLKEKAVSEFFTPEGSYDADRFGTHVHSTTCTMSSLAQLADLLNDRALMDRVRKFFDNGLRQVSDEIGWSIENSSRDSVPDRGEANNTGDILETALILARSDPEYYGRAERILRGHLLACQLRDTSFIRNPENPKGEDGKRNVAERHLGAFGFPAPYGHKPVEAKEISFNMDIVGGAVGSLCEAYRSTVSREAAGHRVNLLFDHETDGVKVQSPYTHDVLSVEVKKPAPLFVRIPSWAPPGQVHIAGAGERYEVQGGWLFIAEPPVGKPVTIEFPITPGELILAHRTRRIRVRVAGDSIKAMENFGAPLAYFDPV